VTQIFLMTTGVRLVQSFPDPGNWNPVNKVECVGSGGGGSNGRGANQAAASGGGGGGYAYANNMALTFPVFFAVEYKSSGGNPLAPSGTATNFNVNSYFATTAAGCVSAASATTGVTPAPILLSRDAVVEPFIIGTGGNAVFPAGFAGGAGGGGSTAGNNTDRGGAGGGAGGPSGAGSAGANGTTTTFGAGGAANGGNVAGATTAGAAGNSRTIWGPSFGVGSGGASSNDVSTAGGAGGAYGGGGSGGFGGATAGVGGAGTDGLIVLTYSPYIKGQTQVFIFKGTATFADPGNWNSVNKIECIGSGGFGSASYFAPRAGELDTPTPLAAQNTGKGGGAGAYAVGTNLAVTFPVTVFVSPGGQQTSPNSIFTYWKGTAAVAGNVYAAAGTSGVGQNGGGNAGTSFYPSGFAGGDGNWTNINIGTPGNGGGGAGGPNGAGTSPTGQLGGASDGGNVPGGSFAGSPGNSGAQWGNYGTGGGGAGGIALGSGGAGGNYGGGGGSSGGNTPYTGGAGGDGLLIVTYVPYIPPLAIQVAMLA
jgi:hypothetical protein